MQVRPLSIAALWATAAGICFAQETTVPYRGTLERLLVIPSYHCSSGTSPVGENVTLPASGEVVVSRSVKCGDAEAKIEFTLNFPLTTPRAAYDPKSPLRITFEANLITTHKSVNTFTHPSAVQSTTQWIYPAVDAPGTAGSEGNCVPEMWAVGPGSGTWSATRSAECRRSRLTSVMPLVENGQTNRYYMPWTGAQATLYWGGTTEQPANSANVRIDVRAYYRLAPPDSLSLNVIAPPPGQRQNPGAPMGNIKATLEYELAGQERGSIEVAVLDQDRKQLLTREPVPVQRGKGSLPLTLTSIHPARNAKEIRVSAELKGASPVVTLAKSAEAIYPVEIDLMAHHAEAIQVVQDSTNSVPLAAGHPTWLRLIGVARKLVTPAFRGSDWQVRAFRDGEELPNSPLLVQDRDLSIYEEADRESPYYLTPLLPSEWTTAGETLLSFEINPAGEESLSESNRADNEGTLTVTFHERPRLDIRARAICLQTGDSQPECPAPHGNVEEAVHLFSLLPFQAGRVSYEELPLPPLIWKHPMVTSDDWNRLVLFLRHSHARMSGMSAPCDQLVGWLPAGTTAALPDGGVLSGLSDPVAYGGQGRVALAASNASDDVDEFERFILTHEIMHNLGLTHPYPQPACSDSDPQMITGEPNLLLGVFYPSSHNHVMTPCDLHGGVSVDQYRQIWDGGFRPSGAGSLPVAASTAKHRGAESNSGECAIVSGVVSRESAEATLDPLVRYECAAVPERATEGEFGLRFISGDGAVLSETRFPVSFQFRESSESFDTRGFLVNTTMPPGATRIALLRGDTELTSRTASPGPPQLQIESPLAGDVWSGDSHEVRWQASDPDGDALIFQLDYSHDGGNSWLPLETDLMATGYRVESLHLQGGKSMLLRVTASDGFNSTSVLAGPFELVQQPSLSAPAEPVDFMNVQRGHTVTIPVPLVSAGSGPVNLLSASAKGPFRVTDALPARIGSGKTRALAVEFTPPADGEHSGTLTLQSDDAATPELVVALSGYGVANHTAELQYSPTALEFPETPAKTSASLKLRLLNRGPAPLRVENINSDSAAVVVTGWDKPIAVPARARLDLTVEFAPAAPGDFSGTITIQTNDPRSNKVSVRVKGRAVAP